MKPKPFLFIPESHQWRDSCCLPDIFSSDSLASFTVTQPSALTYLHFTEAVLSAIVLEASEQIHFIISGRQSHAHSFSCFWKGLFRSMASPWRVSTKKPKTKDVEKTQPMTNFEFAVCLFALNTSFFSRWIVFWEFCLSRTDEGKYLTESWLPSQTVIEKIVKGGWMLAQ